MDLDQEAKEEGWLQISPTLGDKCPRKETLHFLKKNKRVTEFNGKHSEAGLQSEWGCVSVGGCRKDILSTRKGIDKGPASC